MQKAIDKLVTFLETRTSLKAAFNGQFQKAEYPYILIQLLDNTDSIFRYRDGNERIKSIDLIIQFDVISLNPIECYDKAELIRNLLKDTFNWDIPELEVREIGTMKNLTFIEAGSNIERRSIDVTFRYWSTYEGELVDVVGVTGRVKDDLGSNSYVEYKKED